MKPKYPLTQPYDALPKHLPVHVLENALLPGGELPLEFSSPGELALAYRALRTDQLIGMVQPCRDDPARPTYETGCAGRIRQYRERKDGRLNIMLTGVCRYRIVGAEHQRDGYTLATVDWRGFANDYETEAVASGAVAAFKHVLRQHFDRHNMQVDWQVLDTHPIEQVVNNLVLVVNLDVDSKQRLLEAPTVADRLALFSTLLRDKSEPIRAPVPESLRVN